MIAGPEFVLSAHYVRPDHNPAAPLPMKPVIAAFHPALPIPVSFAVPATTQAIGILSSVEPQPDQPEKSGKPTAQPTLPAYVEPVTPDTLPSPRQQPNGALRTPEEDRAHR